MRWSGVIAIVAACAPPTSVQDVLLAQRDRDDGVAIRAHAWQLWDQLAAHDAWEHWAATEQLFQHAPRVAPWFRTPRPFANDGALDIETLPVAFDVRFDPVAERHLRIQHLDERAVLATLPAFPGFPSDALAVKLTWYAVKAHGLTAMPIWDGEPARARGNADRTWQRGVAVDPSARTAMHDPTLARGDFVALVAAHITTKEIPDWTWQTYWWHDQPDVGAYAADRPALAGAAGHYLMDATYSAARPCFNPWLEARFPDGLASNCISCHQRAMIGATDYLPVTHGRLRDDDPDLVTRVQTDFLWSVAFEAR